MRVTPVWLWLFRPSRLSRSSYRHATHFARLDPPFAEEKSVRRETNRDAVNSMKITWSDLNNVQEAGRYAFRDGFITILETEMAIWRSNPNVRFNLMRKNPVRNQIEYVLGIADDVDTMRPVFAAVPEGRH